MMVLTAVDCVRGVALVWAIFRTLNNELDMRGGSRESPKYRGIRRGHRGEEGKRDGLEKQYITIKSHFFICASQL